ncbi:N-acetyltransferase (plasmid) [Bryobacterales bacterium F-183]|nr:N-acetyltransferase [Bryobacterales bacterium F-183]
MSDFRSIAPDVKLGQGVKLAQFVNLYGCEIGDESKLGTFVEVQKNAKIGKRCKISSHSFICEGVTIEDNVFIGHGVMFTNDIYPRATAADGGLQTEKDWVVEPTLVKKGASIGTNATILARVTIGENAIIGAGAVVTKDVPANTIVAGNPARVMRNVPAPAGNSNE